MAIARKTAVLTGLVIDGPEQSFPVGAAGRWIVTNVWTANYSDVGHNGAALQLRTQPAGGGVLVNNGGLGGGTIAGPLAVQQYTPGTNFLDGSGPALAFVDAVLYAKATSVGSAWPAGTTCDLYMEYVDIDG